MGTLLASRTLADQLDRCEDGPGALPIARNPERVLREYIGRGQRDTKVRVMGELTDVARDLHTYRIRQLPDLFEDADRETWEDWRASVAERVDMHDWDCHGCKTAVFTHDENDPCPRCGTYAPEEAHA